ncbi:hypothetical protein [Paucibacter sp. DJ2R-2]|uniref:hypothetical protein n=1 Tax=Paucibacter sp. DJ2R-2 TaxID=2893558 RepID=UPI0021E3B061|nr:hypothetical protein [Paucibacter sp. DJ2R-2]MCV2438682.1 hypothetical protein [Paucibacter sp. DJ2R-2]
MEQRQHCSDVASSHKQLGDEWLQIVERELRDLREPHEVFKCFFHNLWLLLDKPIFVAQAELLLLARTGMHAEASLEGARTFLARVSSELPKIAGRISPTSAWAIEIDLYLSILLVQGIALDNSMNFRRALHRKLYENWIASLHKKHLPTTYFEIPHRD